MAPLGLSRLKALLGRRGRAKAWSVPEASWSRPFGLGWEQPYTVRYASNLDDGPNHGMPLGGFGAGCFGRAPDGHVNLWHLDGGEHWFGVLPDCQFALFESNGDASRAHALAVKPDADASRPDAGEPLPSWDWYPASTEERSTGTYAARYPLSWSQYDGVFDAGCTARPSPDLPGDYRRSSYPVAVFVWTLRNPTDRPLDLSLLLSWRNTTGWFTNTDASAEVHFRDDGSPEHNYAPAIGATGGQRNRWVDDGALRGVVLEGKASQPVAEGQGQWCIATAEQPGVTVQRCSRWNPAGDGRELWDSFRVDGSIPDSNNDRRSGVNDPLSAALAVQCRLEPGESLEIPLVISWDLPVTAFASGSQALRRYTDFFGTGGDNAAAIAAEALRDWRDWHRRIEAWQQPVLERRSLPEPLRMALFNELYDLCSGGSLWTAATPDILRTFRRARVPRLRLVRKPGCAPLRLPGAAAAVARARQGRAAQLRSGDPGGGCQSATDRLVLHPGPRPGGGRSQGERATPTTWGLRMSSPGMPPTTPPIRTATSGRIWPVISCCRSGAPTSWLRGGRTFVFWPSAGRRRCRPCATSSGLMPMPTVCPITAEHRIRPLMTGPCRG